MTSISDWHTVYLKTKEKEILYSIRLQLINKRPRISITYQQTKIWISLSLGTIRMTNVPHQRGRSGRVSAFVHFLVLAYPFPTLNAPIPFVSHLPSVFFSAAPLLAAEQTPLNGDPREPISYSNG